MPTAARAYITVQGTGQPIDNHRAILAIAADFDVFTKGKDVGILALGLASPEEIDDEGLDVDRVLAISGGRVPVIFVNVTFETEELSPTDFAAWEARFDLKLVAETVARF